MLLRNLEEREQALTVFFLCSPSPSPACFSRGNTRFATTPRPFTALCWADCEKPVASRTSFSGPCTRCLASPHPASPSNNPPACETSQRCQRCQKWSDESSELPLWTLWGEETQSLSQCVLEGLSHEFLYNSTGRMALQKLTCPWTRQVRDDLDSADILWKVRPIAEGFLVWFFSYLYMYLQFGTCASSWSLQIV